MYISYSGTHGSGKTTSVYKTATEMKLKHSDKRVVTLTEIASMSPFKINKETTEESQLWIFTSQIKRELEMINMYDIIIGDRSCVDCIGYSLVAGFYALANAMIEVAKCHVHVYNEIRFKTIVNNPYHFKDGIRSSDTKFRSDVEIAILKVYDMIGIKDTLIME